MGHYALVDIEYYFEDFTLLTQNVDGLHSIAGSINLLEIHGNITKNRCLNCNDLTAPGQNKDEIPKCTKCGSILKPDVILFGEPLNQNILRKAHESSSNCEVFFSIGTSSIVEPAASLPYLAKGNGAYIVEINTEKTALSGNADEVILKSSSEALTNLVMILDRLR